MSKVVRALDLGWGYTKYSVMTENGLEFKSFPSVAPRAASVDLSSNVLSRRDTVVVDIEGTQYEVGPDSGDLDTSDGARNLNDQYIFTEQYRAVYLGALAYIGEPVIDLLVVGLPLSGMNLAEQLKEICKGKHRVNKDTLVEVKDVVVLPQPMGGLYYCMQIKDQVEDLKYIKEDMNLVVDPGFLTFDFIVSNGERLIENRSAAYSGGVSKVLRAIADSLSEKFGIRYENYSAIDKGLQRRKLKINGEVEDLDGHIKSTRSVVEGSVNYMRNIVGDGSDIDNIILIGGGANIFKKTVEQFYPKHKVFIVDDSSLTNVKGFQAAGEKLAAKA